MINSPSLGPLFEPTRPLEAFSLRDWDVDAQKEARAAYEAASPERREAWWAGLMVTMWEQTHYPENADQWRERAKQTRQSESIDETKRI